MIPEKNCLRSNTGEKRLSCVWQTSQTRT